MKKILLSVLTLLLTIPSFAQLQTPDVALNNALSKLKTGTSAVRRSKAARVPMKSITLSHTENSTNDTPLFYLYNIPQGGFLIAGADERSASLLGYADDGSFEDIKKSPAFKGWLTDCTNALNWLSQQPISSEDKTSSFGAELSTFGAELSTSVAPLIGQIEWNQGVPYNLMTPLHSNTKDSLVHSVTGCVATATAQVMAYYKWPKSGEGIHENYTDSTQVVDFSQSVYDWDNIKPKYNDDASGDSAMAVAKLMSDVGCAVDMYYGAEASGSDTPYALYAITHHFKYDKGARFDCRKYYTTEVWNSMLREELDNRRPIIMGANNVGDGGHEFVIDGYDSNGLYHINWGWSGICNGYFDINYLDFHKPDVIGNGSCEWSYNINQDVLVNIKPDTLGTSVGTPELRTFSSIQSYNDSVTIFEFGYENIGIGDFTGEDGFVIYDSKDNDKIITCYNVSRKDTPVTIDDYDITLIQYSIPDSITIKEGYRIKPYYKLTPDGEMQEFIPLLSGVQFLEARLDTTTNQFAWKRKTSSRPMLTCADVKVLRNHTGYAPKFQLTISNSADSKMEYNQPIFIYVSNKQRFVSPYCVGETQCFIKPGETKTFEVECCDKYSTISDYSYHDIVAGKYGFLVGYKEGTYRRYFSNRDSITMVTEDSCDLYFSDFALDKTELYSGDTLTTTCKVANKGGFSSDLFDFNIYLKETKKAVANIGIANYDISGYSDTTIVVQGRITLDPGEYYVILRQYSNDKKKLNQDNHVFFTVLGAANGIEAVEMESKLSEGDRKDTKLYNLMGQQIKSPVKGQIYIINGKKFRR